MGLFQAGVVPALDGAGVALTLAGADNVHVLADGEGVHLNLVAHVLAVAVSQTELTQNALRSDVSLSEVALHGLVNLCGTEIAVTQLDSSVAVVLHGLLLNNDAGTGLNDGHRNDIALFVEDLGHTDLLADDCFLHFYTSLVIG